MNIKFTREPIPGGDYDVWANFELEQNRRSDGILTSYLFDNSGALAIKSGKIGIYDDTVHGTFTIDSATDIDLSLNSNYNWIKIEIEIFGSIGIITSTDIAGATSLSELPDEFLDAWDGKKGGYYITAAKRCLGLVFKTSDISGGINQIVNVLSCTEGYIGGNSSLVGIGTVRFLKMAGIEGNFNELLKAIRSVIVDNWYAVLAAEANTWESVCWSPELNLFCAVSIDGTNRVMTSPDGVTWTARSAAEANQWRSVCWSPQLNLFCAVSSTGTNCVMTSPDGITWTARSAAEANQWYSICWSPELNLFCAVSIDGTNRVMTSPDGVTWTARSAAEANQWRSVCWSPQLNLFCAVSSTGTNCVMTSPDGITWTARSAAEANQWYSICWSPELNLYCAVSGNGTNRVMVTAP